MKHPPELVMAWRGDYSLKMAEAQPSPDFPAARRSASADPGLQAERERAAAMTVEERILEALSLRHAYQEIIGSDPDSPSGREKF